MKKRMISLLLVLALVVGICPAALAGEATSYTYHDWAYQLVEYGVASWEFKIWLDGDYSVSGGKITSAQNPTVILEEGGFYSHPTFINNVAARYTISSDKKSVKFRANFNIWVSFDTFEMCVGAFEITGTGYSDGTTSIPVCKQTGFPDARTLNALSEYMASTAESEFTPKASFITKRITIDVPFTIPATTITSPNNGATEDFDAFNSICEIKVDAVVNENTGKIASVSPISYGVKAGYASPWASTTLQVQSLLPTNLQSGGVKISKDTFGIDVDLNLTVDVRYRILVPDVGILAHEEIKTFNNLRGTAYIEAA